MSARDANPAPSRPVPRDSDVEYGPLLAVLVTAIVLSFAAGLFAGKLDGARSMAFQGERLGGLEAQIMTLDSALVRCRSGAESPTGDWGN